MTFTLLFYSSGNSNYIMDFIRSTEKPTQAKILRSLDLVGKYGLNVGMPHIKKMTKNLFELRVRGKQEVRLFFSTEGDKILFLHGFIKRQIKLQGTK